MLLLHDEMNHISSLFRLNPVWVLKDDYWLLDVPARGLKSSLSTYSRVELRKYLHSILEVRQLKTGFSSSTMLSPSTILFGPFF